MNITKEPNLKPLNNSHNKLSKPTSTNSDKEDIIDYSQAVPLKVVEVGPHGRYAKLNTILGKGAYKVVYKALDREEGYEVAWNCLQRTSQAEYQEFITEIEILKKMRHPNIISFHDCWYNNNQEFVFITELMTSGTLREYIHAFQLPNLKIVKRWARQILRGICYLHSQNPPVIHRDIKCDNIFINGAHGEVKIGDMGTAKMKQGKRYTVIGTPEFMAPEMYEEKGYSEKVDVYAFGMCLLEMVTGEYPYIECTNAAQVYKRVSQGIKPEGLKKIYDSDVLDLINNCISSENERFSTDDVTNHVFMAHDPEVILVSAVSLKLILEVVFRGSEKLSIKFDFDREHDTAEEVVNEMIEENVLPDTYRNLIKFEINRILRDLSKPSVEESSSINSSYDSWQKQKGIQTQLYNVKKELELAHEKLSQAEKKAVLSEQRALAAEEKTNNLIKPDIIMKNNKPRNFFVNAYKSIKGDNKDHKRTISHNPEKTFYETDANTSEPSVNRIEWDNVSIETLVKHVANSTNREKKESEWLQKFKDQDIICVGDLKNLHDADWNNLGLTVFANRAFKNCLDDMLGNTDLNSASPYSTINKNP